MNPLALLGSLVATGLLLCSFQRPPPEASEARLLIEARGEVLDVRGLFTNGGGLPGRLRYRLLARKQGPSGTSTSQQSGTFQTRPGATEALGTIRLRVQAGDRVLLYFTVLDGERVIARDGRNLTLP